MMDRAPAPAQRRSRRRQPLRLERLPLAPLQDRHVEILDQLVEEPVPVDLGGEVEEDRAEADRRAVHEDELARRADAAELPQVAMHGLGDIAAIDAGFLFLDPPLAVVEQRRVDEARPAAQDGDHLARETLEAPGLVGMDGERLVLALQREIEVDDALDEARPEDADAAEIEEVDPVVGAYRVIA